MPPGTSLDAFNDHVAAWVSEALDPYLEFVPGPTSDGTRRIGKEVNDPLWGTIGLHAAEVAVVDNPMHQRLRQIRQLGVVHYLYPSANHTRFEHSLGACFQITRLAESINAHAPGEDLLGRENIRLLRLVALCHDLGHGFMSHVSDNAVRRDPSVRKLVREFKEKHGVEPQLSEIAAYAIVTSPSFGNLLKRAREYEGGLENSPNLAVQVGQMIVGLSPIADQPFLHELISGPFDADKLDYLPRDAKFCGVPVPTDVGRLVQKLRAVRMDTSDLNEEIRMVDPDKVPSAVYIGLAPSGASALDEVSIGRSLMFDKVYRHHKVRASEAMVAAAIAELGPLLAREPALIPLSMPDEEFLNLSQHDLDELRRLQPMPLDEEFQRRCTTGLDLLARLKERRMFVRAYAFSQHLPDDQNGTGRRDAVEEMMRSLLSHPNLMDGFIEAVVTKVQQILALQGVTPVDLPASANMSSYIRVDPADATRSGEAGEHDGELALLVDDDGTLRAVSKVEAQSRGWSEAYIQTHDLGYVFTTKELAPYVYIAASVVAYEKYQVQTPVSAARYAKQDRKRLDDLQRALEIVGFFGSLPYALRPIPSIFSLRSTAKRIETVRKKLQGYQGMLSMKDLADPTPAPEKVQDWVTQFGEKYANHALHVLENVKVLDATLAAQAYQAFMEGPHGATFKGSSICSIGSANDGGSAVSTALRALAQEYKSEVVSDVDALQKDAPILFVDDFIGRGSATITSFEGKLGLPDTAALQQTRPQPLPTVLAQKLRARPVGLLYLAGMDWHSELGFEQKLSDIGLDVKAFHVHLAQAELPTLSSIAGSAADPSTWDEFVVKCQSIGLELMSSSPKASERALGYGNAGLLLCSTYNTPTATLTCLWADGQVGGWAWTPFLRRIKSAAGRVPSGPSEVPE